MIDDETNKDQYKIKIKGSIILEIVKCDILEEKYADVIINTSNKELNHAGGALSSMLIKKGGDMI